MWEGGNALLTVRMNNFDKNIKIADKKYQREKKQFF